MTAPRLIEESVVLAVHDRLLALHGGADGLRDAGALSSALARPAHRLAYGNPDLAELAAAYAFGIAKGHAFVDGNKRTALTVALLFLALNGARTVVDQAEAVEIMVRLAAGKVTEEDLALWIRSRDA